MLAGRYEFTRELGAGGFGVVWAARDLHGDDSVAVKVLTADAADDLSRFAREALSLSRLQHPNIVRFLSYEQDSQFGPVIITELVDGVSLREWAAVPRPLDDVLRVLRQIASALDAAHRGGVVHRDLKPENVLVVGESAHVIVVDFGLARLRDDRQHDVTKTGVVLGTPGHMSPEQLRGLREIGPTSDLYAFGALAYLVVQGRPVFAGHDMLSVAMAHLTEPAPRIERADVPPSIIDLVAQLLEKDPILRPQSAIAVLNRMTPALTPQRPAATAPERPRGTHAIVATFIVVVSVVGRFHMGWRRRRAEPTPRPTDLSCHTKQRGAR